MQKQKEPKTDYSNEADAYRQEIANNPLLATSSKTNDLIQQLIDVMREKETTTITNYAMGTAKPRGRELAAASGYPYGGLNE